MLKALFKPRERMNDALRNELHSLCHAQQVQTLKLPRSLQRDVGLDCGCETARPPILPTPL